MICKQPIYGLKKIIFYDKPFPYSAVKLSELTGFSLRSIFNSLSNLEKLRLIVRSSGLGNNRRFSRGTILNKILTTVQNRIKHEQDKNLTTAHHVHQNLNNRAPRAYKKTSLSLKPKEGNFFIDSKKQDEQHNKKLEEYRNIMEKRKNSR